MKLEYFNAGVNAFGMVMRAIDGNFTAAAWAFAAFCASLIVIVRGNTIKHLKSRLP